ncbi:sulfite exporter TauE/SafE family protein [Rhodalgimonas zhirmunskyi]|uniref:Probable membrane transporter protein n=1 Tax=Rhodalgimonas zhirmunskyi TaxID=2964767 RepID=A0AAJ1U8W8_9RHOB|nr:sulfite exporter TauE/SafE family protein [Rhodoalgimonas zhirmunskyi]MDQ2093298.1 sulfite exporter TauE/SafE family protein [Rhodoalgimonas zhirmunskyi]
MTEALTQVFAIPGVGWLLAAAFVAGVVRGFAGFGTAMIFLPVAAQVVDPVTAIMVLVLMDFIGPLPAIPAALRNGHPRDLMRLVIGTLFMLPIGLAVLFWVDPTVFKLAVSLISLAMLVLLVGGLRYRGAMTPPLIYATGGLSGLLGGAVGIPGPPVILLYMASPHPASVIRANNMAYLFFYTVLMAVSFLVTGKFTVAVLVLGLVAALPYLLGNMMGWWIFRPGYERLYRVTAYLIIAASALSGLASVVSFGGGAG